MEDFAWFADALACCGWGHVHVDREVVALVFRFGLGGRVVGVGFWIDAFSIAGCFWGGRWFFWVQLWVFVFALGILAWILSNTIDGCSGGLLLSVGLLERFLRVAFLGFGGLGYCFRLARVRDLIAGISLVDFLFNVDVFVLPFLDCALSTGAGDVETGIVERCGIAETFGKLFFVGGGG